jgi:hypothetical protein
MSTRDGREGGKADDKEGPDMDTAMGSDMSRELLC